MVHLTYVGSFPLKNTIENITKATKDLLSIPIDYPNYVQLEDMVHQFLQPISVKYTSGTTNYWDTEEGERYSLSRNLKTFKNSISNDAFKILLKFSKNNEFKKDLKGIKACVTGPFTLSSRIMLNNRNSGPFGETALSNPSVVKKITDVVSKIVGDYYKMGADYVTIDEPLLSVLVGKNLLLNQYPDAEIVEIINKCSSEVKSLSGIHICGRISRRLAEILLQSNISVIDHEFKDTESNFGVYSKSDFESHDKKLGFAVTSSKIMRIESVAEIELMLTKGLKTFGKENILMVKPDCGFRGLDPKGHLDDTAYTSSISKLKNIRLAFNSLQRKKIL